MVTQITEPTSFPKLSAEDVRTLQTARAELIRTDKLIQEIRELPEKLRTAGERFSAGEIPLLTAAGLLSARNSEDRRLLIAGVKKPVQRRQCQILESCSEVFAKIRQHVITELADKCATLEKAERKTSADLGISADLYIPSGSLLSLREQHKRSHAEMSGPVTRQDLAALETA